MPRRTTHTKPETRQVMENVSYESRVVYWLMQDGWQVFTPVLDNGHQTDILISDGPTYHRVQVKTIEGKGDDQQVQNKWENSNVDVVVFFARNSDWGYVTPAFAEKSRKLNSPGHQKFSQDKKDFHRAFHLVESP